MLVLVLLNHLVITTEAMLKLVFWRGVQLISFCQIFFAIPGQYGVTVPTEYIDATAWMGIFSLDLLDIYPGACVGEYAQQVLIQRASADT